MPSCSLPTVPRWKCASAPASPLLGDALNLIVHLGRGSVIVQAKHRTQGHFYVDTGDCRVAVTGTLFGVTAGVKGSRIIVFQGEVHVTADTPTRFSTRAIKP